MTISLTITPDEMPYSWEGLLCIENCAYSLIYCRGTRCCFNGLDAKKKKKKEFISFIKGIIANYFIRNSNSFPGCEAA